MNEVKRSRAQRHEDLPWPEIAMAFVGEALDDRGEAAVTQVGRSTARVEPAVFDLETGAVNVAGVPHYPEDLTGYLGSPSSILLEATTLGFVEVFLLTKAALEAGAQQLSILYVEPEQYLVRPRELAFLDRRDFELSDEVREFSGVPRAAIMLTSNAPTKAVFFVGYEGQRLEQALENTNIVASRSSVIFGVPAFQTGWEMDSFANNVEIIDERRIGEVAYASASDPFSAYEILEEISAARLSDERMLVVPIGTKPHGIAAALFAATHEDVGLLYDHPIRRQGRSSRTGVWHLFTVS